METQNVNLYYQPKGSMCSVCKHRDRNCSDLPFHKMKKLEQQHCRVIVKCSEFEREKFSATKVECNHEWYQVPYTPTLVCIWCGESK